jgi:hypothetical protein
MVQTATGSSTLSRIGIVSTLVDAAVAFSRGRPLSGLLLLASAAFSKRVPGIGVAVSILLRLIRRLR